MSRNNTWRWAIVLFVTFWAAYELIPPTPRDLIETFRNHASGTDTNFNAIVARAEAMQKTNSANTYGNLKTAVGTNDISRYFPTISTAGEANRSDAVLKGIQKKAAGKIRLGLDLQGGVEFMLSLDLTNKASITNMVSTGTNAVSEIAASETRTRLIEQSIEVLRKRIDRLGVAEPVLQPAGDNRIIVQMPGLNEADFESTKVSIQKAAFLEFKMVADNSGEQLAQGILEPGYEVKQERRKNQNGQDELFPVVLEKRSSAGLTGKNIVRAMVISDPMSGRPIISFELDGAGADAFAKTTRENVGRRMAIILDGVLISAPNITEPITGGRGQISGNYEVKEAYELAYALENPLEAPLKIDSVRTVAPSLGEKSIKDGFKASLIGLLAVSIFMLVYYRLSGLVANIALVVNSFLLLGVMCSIGTTLTLPGIAGIVLTIGMAVDANVLIYERIREELAAGKSLRGAIAAGYDRAFGTIFDSHLTSLISSIILIVLGTGPIKGFGVTLTIGVALSLFTALVITRLCFDWLVDNDKIKTLNMMSMIRAKGLDFMKYAKPAFVISWTLIIIGIGYGIHRGTKVLGPDFAGGDNTVLAFSKKVDQGAVAETLKKAGLVEPTIQFQKELVGGSETLRIFSAFGTSSNAVATLQKDFPDAGFSVKSVDQIGAVVGSEIAKTAFLSVFLALLGILVYVAFRYEFSFAVAAVVAVIHDVLMTMGWFFLTGRELSAPMVAAVLTIIGFSINDTIVIFDRIREDLKLGVPGTFRDVMNKALNQTLSRTIITSGTVFLSTLSLYLFGGGVINDFAFTFLVGIITGTYSSIYIASAMVLWWHKGQRPVKLSTTTVVSEIPVGTRTAKA